MTAVIVPAQNRHADSRFIPIGNTRKCFITVLFREITAEHKLYLLQNPHIVYLRCLAFQIYFNLPN